MGKPCAGPDPEPEPGLLPKNIKDVVQIAGPHESGFNLLELQERVHKLRGLRARVNRVHHI